MLKKYVVIAMIFFSISAYADLIDPTQPTQPAMNLSGGSAEDGFQLNAIMYSGSNPLVIINGNILHLNDVIGTYRVTEIHKQSVQLMSQKGEVINLKLDALDVKKPHI